MKKTLLIITLVMAIGTAINAQDYRTGVGLRLGMPYGLSAKHFLNETNAVEGILASSYNGIVITGLYENEHWTGWYPGINWYWGFGAHLGFWDNSPWVSGDSGGILGADFILGLEYTFDEVPINLSMDIIPSINIIGATGWNGFLGGLSVRYIF
jgi:hypothetical protein